MTDRITLYAIITAAALIAACFADWQTGKVLLIGFALVTAQVLIGALLFRASSQVDNHTHKENDK